MIPASVMSQRPDLRARRRAAGGSRVIAAIADFPVFGNLSCRKRTDSARLYALSFAIQPCPAARSRARFPGEDAGTCDQVVDFALAAAQGLLGLPQHLPLHQDLDHALVAAGDDQIGPFALAGSLK